MALPHRPPTPSCHGTVLVSINAARRRHKKEMLQRHASGSRMAGSVTGEVHRWAEEGRRHGRVVFGVARRRHATRDVSSIPGPPIFIFTEKCVSLPTQPTICAEIALHLSLFPPPLRFAFVIPAAKGYSSVFPNLAIFESSRVAWDTVIEIFGIKQ